MKKEKPTYEELLLENDIFRFVIDKIHEGVYITDENGIIIEYNETVQETEGFRREDVIYKNENDIYGNLPDYDFIMKYADPVRKSKQPLKDVCYEYNLGFGKKTSVIMNIYPYIVEGRVKSLCTIGRNVNQIKDFLIDTLGLENRRAIHSGTKNTGAKYFFEDIIGKSDVMKRTISLTKQVAKRDSPILIYGETGTGKELIAQSIHNGSLFLDGPFVSVNCAAIPETLLESILFGVSKGSFTGAVEGPGLFEQANGGTLFLDEINSMPLSLQPKILRAIQEKTVRRIGGKKEIPINCRILSAVNKDPKMILEQGVIRDDLFFRLATIELRIPPLKDRKEDIEYLVYEFIRKYNIRFGLFVEGVSPPLLNILMQYDWPGNIRELENLVESSMNLISREDTILRPQHLSDYFQEKFFSVHKKAQVSVHSGFSTEPVDRPLPDKMREVEKSYIISALHQYDGNVSKAAEKLGISRQNLHYRLRRFNLHSADYCEK